MKKFLTVVGLLTLVATPAFAQSYDQDYGTGNVINPPAMEQQVGGADASSAYAQAPAKHTARRTAKPTAGQTSIDPYSPTVTGGGNEGYNWDLENDN